MSIFLHCGQTRERKCLLAQEKASLRSCNFVAGKSYAWGCGGARKVLSVVEVYSPESNTWTTITPMSSARCMAMAAVF